MDEWNIFYNPVAKKGQKKEAPLASYYQLN